MSDWQVGDLAVCVDASGDVEGLLQDGSVYVVDRFIPLAPFQLDPPMDALELQGVRRGNFVHQGFGARRFRKIRPDKHEACEDEFVTLLKRKKVSA